MRSPSTQPLLKTHGSAAQRARARGSRQQAPDPPPGLKRLEARRTEGVSSEVVRRRPGSRPWQLGEGGVVMLTLQWCAAMVYTRGGRSAVAPGPTDACAAHRAPPARTRRPSARTRGQGPHRVAETVPERTRWMCVHLATPVRARRRSLSDSFRGGGVAPGPASTISPMPPPSAHCSLQHGGVCLGSARRRGCGKRHAGAPAPPHRARRPSGHAAAGELPQIPHCCAAPPRWETGLPLPPSLRVGLQPTTPMWIFTSMSRHTEFF